ncbi:MAG: sugar phosphate nucleotidyltransferase [bacterium]|nr:sugar phosphate nucleotidyltransferase [bacterium]
MEEFLGVLFCGGKGTRLGEITKYISKSFIPVYDKPVFKFGLSLLQNSAQIKEIIILTNKDNDKALKTLGYQTIIQNDSVSDMFSGWEFVKKRTKTKKNGVLVPSDNICDVDVDLLIRRFNKTKTEFLFSLHEIKNKAKLSEMGSFDTKKRKFYYKKSPPEVKYGVIAPYIIKNDLNYKTAGNIFEINNSEIVFHKGIWFDIGDTDSIIRASQWRQKNK